LFDFIGAQDIKAQVGRLVPILWIVQEVGCVVMCAENYRDWV
jgi:hypothetical protein